MVSTYLWIRSLECDGSIYPLMSCQREVKRCTFSSRVIASIRRVTDVALLVSSCLGYKGVLRKQSHQHHPTGFRPAHTLLACTSMISLSPFHSHTSSKSSSMAHLVIWSSAPSKIESRKRTYWTSRGLDHFV